MTPARPPSASERPRARAGRALILAALVGCAPVASPLDVEVAVRAADGTFSLDTVPLETATDVLRGESTGFTIRAGANLSLLELALVSDDIEGADAVATRETLRGTSGGSVVSPALSWDPLGARWVADDFDSLLYLTAFAGLERVQAYYRDVIGDTSRATTDTALVSLYGDATMASFIPVSFPVFPKADNAAYHPLYDMFFLMRVFDQDGVPFAMHDAILAHEYQHRVHHWRVTARDVVYPAWLAEQGSRAATLLRGVDEGLCDAFAVGHVMGAPEFLAGATLDAPWSLNGAAGLGFETVGRFRDLDGAFARTVTWEMLESGVYPTELDELTCGAIAALSEDPPEALAEVAFFNPYCLGTLVARMVLEAAQFDGALLRDEVLPAVHDALAGYADRVEAGIDDDGRLTFDVAWILDAIAEAQAPAARDRFCAAIAPRFASVVDDGRVPACP